MKRSRRSFMGGGLAALAILLFGKREPPVQDQGVWLEGSLEKFDIPDDLPPYTPSYAPLPNLRNCPGKKDWAMRSVWPEDRPLSPLPETCYGVDLAVGKDQGTWFVVQSEDGSCFKTDDITADPVVWTELEAGEL